MLCAAFPDGIPGEGGGDQGVMVDLTEEEEDTCSYEILAV